MIRKYEFTGETLDWNGYVLRRIRRLSDEQLGGWIESEENLSHLGNCWVDDEAVVFSRARVFDNALVYGKSLVCNSSVIYENARIFDTAKIRLNAKVFGNAQVYGNAWVSDDTKIYGNTKIYGSAKITGNSQVYNEAEISEGTYYNIDRSVSLVTKLKPISVNQKPTQVPTNLYSSRMRKVIKAL
jgi:carbonic anhydrase/acetyltransferase-like protein (isoleucine patch superfamily)